MSKRIIVVGSGIIGASIAWHLAKSGAEVTIIERDQPGGIATRNSWAWINASWGNPEPYFRLRERSMLEWRKIDREVPGLAVNWCGGLIWDLEPDALVAFAREHAAWGYGIRRVERREILRLEPNLQEAPAFAYHVAEEGMVEPLAVAEAMVAGAASHGAQVLSNTFVRWLVEDGGKVTGVMTQEGAIHADETVIAAGADTAGLLDSVGVVLKMSAPAGLLTHSKPAGELLRGLVMSPGLHMRQTAEGRIVAGTDFAGADPEGDAEGLAADLHGKVQAMVKGAGGLKLDYYTVGNRPTPADGFPAVGRPRNRDGLYVAVTHSGITLAPVIGLFAAQELLDGIRDPLLASYHPDRPTLT
jgi:glycine/D-amino acid oxidase-like deaminating enzyme